MTLVKVNPKPFRSMDRWMDDMFEPFFRSGFPRLTQDDLFKKDLLDYPPMNVAETDNEFRIELAVPGMKKNDFKVNVDGNSMTISAEKKEESKNESDKDIRREFSYRSFTRSFTLDNRIDSSKIDASYEDGVLKLILPKKDEVKKITKEIAVK